MSTIHDLLLPAPPPQEDGSEFLHQARRPRRSRNPRAPAPAPAPAYAPASAEPSSPVASVPVQRRDSMLDVAFDAVIRSGITLGWAGWTVVLAAVMLVATTIYAHRSAPSQTGPVLLRMKGEEIPKALSVAWLKGFPASQRLLTHPDTEVLVAFAAYLRQQPEILRVDQLVLRPELIPGHEGQVLRSIDAYLVLRRPVLPVALADGRRAYLAADGTLLSRELDGPAGPLVRGVEEGGRAAVEEVLAAWDLLHDQLPPGLITTIHAYAPLDPAGRTHGVVLEAASGTRLEWGGAGEAVYGVDRQERARNLVHAIRCQGDLRQVQRINVRFEEPFAVLR